MPLPVSSDAVRDCTDSAVCRVGQAEFVALLCRDDKVGIDPIVGVYAVLAAVSHIGDDICRNAARLRERVVADGLTVAGKGRLRVKLMAMPLPILTLSKVGTPFTSVSTSPLTTPTSVGVPSIAAVSLPSYCLSLTLRSEIVSSLAEILAVVFAG